MLSQQTSSVEFVHHLISFDDAGENSESVGDGGDATLEDAAASEREYLRDRLRGELKRDPTEEELDEWLREHTEGY